MTRVIDLTPGDQVDHGLASGIFIARCPHPLYVGLDLVIWMTDHGISLDALNPLQDVGEVASRPDQSIRAGNLRMALHGRRS